jgi:hypothetical protein
MTLKIEIEVPEKHVAAGLGADYIEKALSSLGYARELPLFSSADPQVATMTVEEAFEGPSTTHGFSNQTVVGGVPDMSKPKRGRKPAEPATAPQAISTGEERINPQDAADEAAETAAKPNIGITSDDLRRAAGNYSTLFGMAAAISDIPQIIGGAIADVPQNQLVAAIAKIGKAVSENPFKRSLASAAEPEIIAAKEPRKASKQDVIGLMMAYMVKFDGPEASPYDASTRPVAEEDMPRLMTRVFGDGVTKFSQVPDDEIAYGKLVDGLEEMLAKNPFNREAK